MGMNKKCIIIGSGLGGLSTGVVLAREGYEVTILEKEGQIGGCLQCFMRRGVKFETGMHFIGSAKKGETLNRLFRFLEIDDKIQLDELDPMGYDIIKTAGQEFKIPNGENQFIEQLSQYFPSQRDNISTYIKCVNKVANSSSLHTLDASKANMSISTEYQLRSINDVIEGITDDRTLQDVLVGNLPLYAGQRNKTPFSTHAFIVNFYNQSGFRVVGGSDAISEALEKVLEKYGGRVITKTKVSEILDDGNKVTGVRAENGEVYDADIVVSAIHPTTTLSLTKSALIRKAFRTRLSSLPNTTGIFSVYLDFKDDKMPYLNSNYYGYPKFSPWESENYTLEDWPRGYLYMHLCHKANPQFAKSGVILSYMHFSEIQKWIGTHVGQRGADYEAFKNERAQRLIDCVAHDHPNLRGAIRNIYTSTPLTYLDYTGTPEGSAYGIAKDVTLGVSCHIPQRTKLPGLYLTGQNINSHGILGVLVGTIVTCSEFLGTEYLYNKIKEG